MKEKKIDATIADVAHILDCLRLLREIYNTGDCNNCKIKNDCEYVPKAGQMVRYNCPFYKESEE